MRMRGAVFFDIDGTLVPQTTTGSYLAEYLGHSEAMRRIERMYAEGMADNRAVCDADAAGFAGISVERVYGLLDGLPLMEGIAEAVAMCRDHGFAPYIASVAWTLVGSYFVKRFGFEGCCGPELEVDRGIVTGRVPRYFDEVDKREYALSVCCDRGLDPLDCIALGDSRSDLPLFGVVGCSVAVNASPAIRRVSTVCYEGRDIVRAVDLGMNRIEGRA